jgi:hypothetical protein
MILAALTLPSLRKRSQPPYGLIKTAWLDWPEPFTKYLSAYESVPPWQVDKSFDWTSVVRMCLTARRLDNGPIRYRLHILDVSQLSMMAAEKLKPQRANLPYRGTARLDLAMLGLDLPGCKVYRADTKMNLTPVTFERQGAVLTFPVEVDGNWAEFLVR